MAKLLACVIAYNEEALLPGCLGSLQGKVDQITVVDGRIAEYPGEGTVSTDRTAAIALEHNAYLIQRFDRAWNTEQEMRNEYLLGEEGDWYFVIDADEMLMTPLPYPDQLPDWAWAFKVRVEMMGYEGQTRYIPRLYKHNGNMEYKHTHDSLHSNGRWVNRHHVPELPSVVLLHRQPLRDKQRWDKKKVKRRVCREREDPIRERLGLL